MVKCSLYVCGCEKTRLNEEVAVKTTVLMKKMKQKNHVDLKLKIELNLGVYTFNWAANMLQYQQKKYQICPIF